MNRTKIEYLDFTWNPIAMRCDRVDDGCLNCWHLRMCNRMMKNPKLPAEVRAAHAGKAGPLLVESRLKQPSKRKKPATIGAQFMGDLFHSDIYYETIERAWEAMGRAYWHTFIVLTKRPRRMAYYLEQTAMKPRSNHFPNIWLGVSAHDQASARRRIGILLKIPAEGRILSYEPALGPLDLEKALCQCAARRPDVTYGCCGHHHYCPASPHHDQFVRSLDGVIAGGETGPEARWMDPGWARDVRDQCKAAGTSFFMKQLSGRKPIPDDLMVRQFPWEV